MADTPKGACLCGGIVGADNLRVTKGADMISACTSEFAPRNFCSGCGSRIYDDLGEKYFVTAGLMRELDLELSFSPQVAYKAPWHSTGDDAPQFAEGG